MTPPACSPLHYRRAKLSVEEFQRFYEVPNRPVILSDAAADWPARARWTRSYLLQAFAGREVRGQEGGTFAKFTTWAGTCLTGGSVNLNYDC